MQKRRIGEGEKRSGNEDERNRERKRWEEKVFTVTVSPIHRFSASGFPLCLDDQILHLSIFTKTNGMEHAAQGARISRFSMRIRYRY
jgi:hypothetical protein